MQITVEWTIHKEVMNLLCLYLFHSSVCFFSVFQMTLLVPIQISLMT